MLSVDVLKLRLQLALQLEGRAARFGDLGLHLRNMGPQSSDLLLAALLDLVPALLLAGLSVQDGAQLVELLLQLRRPRPRP